MAGATASQVRSRRGDAALTRWERCMGHAGYVAEGVFYLPLGFFALLAATGSDQPNGSAGALSRIGGTLLGDLLLVPLALGLAAFVVWNLFVAIADPEHRAERSNRRRWLRVGHLLNGAFHCVFVFEAVRSLFGAHKVDERQSQVQWTARVLSLPAGRVVIALVGAGVVIFGFWQFYRAVTGDKNKRLDLRRARLRWAISALGVYGLSARCALFCLVGSYLINASWRHDPKYSGGVAGVLSALRQQPRGEWLLGVMAAGLLSYGLYQIVKEPYRKLSRS